MNEELKEWNKKALEMSYSIEALDKDDNYTSAVETITVILYDCHIQLKNNQNDIGFDERRLLAYKAKLICQCVIRSVRRELNKTIRENKNE